MCVHRPAVVRELDDIIIVGILLSIFHHFKKRLGDLFSIDFQLSIEKPMTTMFAKIERNMKHQNRLCISSTVLYIISL